MTDLATDGGEVDGAEIPFALPATWSVGTFDRDEYGPENVEGIAATYELDDGDDRTVLSVDPVTYRREAGDEYIRGLVSAFEYDWFNPEAEGSVPHRVAFAVRYDVAAVGRPKEGIFGLFTDAVDALAVALALTSHTDEPRGLREHVRNHDGQSRGSRIRESDAEALARTLAAVGPDPAPDRCPYTGKTTSSHAVSVPVRYAAAIAGYPRTDPGMIRVPHRSDRIRAVVSHQAWTDRDLDAVDFEAPSESVGAESLDVDDDLAAVLSDVDPGALAIATF